MNQVQKNILAGLSNQIANAMNTGKSSVSWQGPFTANNSILTFVESSVKELGYNTSIKPINKTTVELTISWK